MSTFFCLLQVLKTRMCLRKTGQYNSVMDCAAHIYRELGLRGFFRGYVVNLVGVIPYAGIELATYEVNARRPSQFLPFLRSFPSQKLSFLK